MFPAVGVFAGLGLLLIAGCSGEIGRPKPVATTSPASTVASTATAVLAPTAPPAPSALSANQIVLSLEELNDLVAEAKYRSGPELADAQAPLQAGGRVDPQECAPALRGLQNKSVAGDGTTSFRVVESVTVGDSSLPEAKRRKDDFVQVVAVYPDAEAAKSVFAALANGVAACQNRKATDVEPGEEAKTEYTVRAERVVGSEDDGSARVRWSQHQSGWGENQQCVLEARAARNVVLQDIECGLGTAKGPVGQLLAPALDKALARVG
ncbi:MAG: sensor domain-containing protein [Segniliparus sp.]|uniref:sensor domain-containing protein n=1 Tax=Segniliparus sp. TaxID=2804064 RepID=UPI003F3B48FB